MADKSWVVLIAALVFWTVLFYLMDRLIMQSQGLPVGSNLMPL